MAIRDIITALETEINRLQQVRNLLAPLGKTTKLHTSTATKSASKPAKKRRSKMSAEARARIAEAQRKRWAKQKASK
jgi:hypothetical protein